MTIAKDDATADPFDQAQPLTLSPGEREQLVRNEQGFEKVKKHWEQGNEFLFNIWDGALYRETARTFKEYMQVRWGISRRRTDQIIQSLETIRLLENHGSQKTDQSDENHGSMLPTGERQSRPLNVLPVSERKDAWKEAVETAPKDPKTGRPKVTAKHVQKVVAKRTGADGEKVLDKLGQAVPEPLVPVFGSVSQAFAEGLNNLTQLTAALNRIMGNPKEVFKASRTPYEPPPGSHKLIPRRQEIDSNIDAVRTLLNGVAPYAVCPMPHGKMTNCAVCKGIGWVTVDQYNRLPVEYRKGGT